MLQDLLTGDLGVADVETRADMVAHALSRAGFRPITRHKIACLRNGKVIWVEEGENLTTSTLISFDDMMQGTTVRLRRGDGKTTTVKVPQGVRDGQKLKLRGKGHSGPGGPGDLILTVKVGGHPVFARKEDSDDLLVTVPVSFPEAALGATIQVPKPAGGTVSLRIPAGTSSGRRFRVKGAGVPAAKGAGSLIVTVEVAVPAELDETARRAVEDFAAATADSDPRAQLLERAGS